MVQKLLRTGYKARLLVSKVTIYKNMNHLHFTGNPVLSTGVRLKQD